MPPTRRFIGALFTLAILLTPLTSLRAADPPALARQFPLGVYWPWERTEGLARRNHLEKWAFVERCLDDLKTRGFDAVWAVNLGIGDLPGLAQRMAARGMLLVPALGELHYNVPWRRNNWTYLHDQSKLALQAAGDSSAILAWALCDEPTSAIVAEMDTFRQKFIAWGAKQPPVVVTMWPDSPIYAQKAGFDVVCTDLYPFFATGNPNGPNTPAISRAWYRRQAEVTVEAARKTGKTPWIMPQCFVEIWGPWKYDQHQNAVMLPGAILNWRQPTVGETRWQVWSAVGLGTQGFFWFVYLPPQDDHSQDKPYVGPTFPPSLAVQQPEPLDAPGALVRPDGSATPEYLAAAEAFQSLKSLLPLLSGTLPADTPLGTVSPPGWIAALMNHKLNRTFAVVVNDDTDRPQMLRIHLQKPIAMRNLRTGQTLKPDQDKTVLLELGPGDGALLEPVQ